MSIVLSGCIRGHHLIRGKFSMTKRHSPLESVMVTELLCNALRGKNLKKIMALNLNYSRRTLPSISSNIDCCGDYFTMEIYHELSENR